MQYMNRHRNCHSEVNQKDKIKYHMVSFIRGIIVKDDTSELIYKTERDWQISKINTVAKGETWREEQIRSLELTYIHYYI